MPIITVALYRRPTYTRRVLEALRACHGIEKYTVLVSVDFFSTDLSQRLANMVREILGTACPVECVQQVRHIGCDANTYYCLDWGFSGGDYVIHCEDDIVFSRDALRYFEWGRSFQSDPNCLTICAYHRDDTRPARADEAAKVHRSHGFCAWGWATWKDRWLELRRRLLELNADGWDVAINSLRGRRHQLCPRIARSCNIGVLDGTYCTGPEYHRLYHDNSSYFAELLGVESQEFELAIDLAAMAEASGRYEYERVGYDRRSMVLEPSGFVGDGAAACETHWCIEQEELILTADDTSTIARLVRGNDGAWHGRWTRFERMPVVLRRQ